MQSLDLWVQHDKHGKFQYLVLNVLIIQLMFLKTSNRKLQYTEAILC